MDAGTVSSGIDSSTTLVVAFLAMLGVTVPPIVVALINRSGKAKDREAPNIDLIDDLDHINDRLGRENERLQTTVQRQAVTIDRLEREVEQLRATRGQDT